MPIHLHRLRDLPRVSVLCSYTTAFRVGLSVV
jgi:hypothetical protein